MSQTKCTRRYGAISALNIQTPLNIFPLPKDRGITDGNETNDVQCFLSLVQYLAHFMPDVSAYSGPLAAIKKNGHPFLWKPLHQVCMDNIKALACKTPILQPIDPSLDEPIWVICDASASGIGAVYGQGQTWKP